MRVETKSEKYLLSCSRFLAQIPLEQIKSPSLLRNRRNATRKGKIQFCSSVSHLRPLNKCVIKLLHAILKKKNASHIPQGGCPTPLRNVRLYPVSVNFYRERRSAIVPNTTSKVILFKTFKLQSALLEQLTKVGQTFVE